MWTRCWPVAKLWYPEIEGTCWTTVTMERYQTFTSGRWLSRARFGLQGFANTVGSVFWHYGHRACYPSVEDRLECRY
jgi:hypothetical protein